MFRLFHIKLSIISITIDQAITSTITDQISQNVYFSLRYLCGNLNLLLKYLIQHEILVFFKKFLYSLKVKRNNSSIMLFIKLR